MTGVRRGNGRAASPGRAADAAARAGAGARAGAAADRAVVLVVGVGDDGPSGLGRADLDAIRAADVLVGGRRHLRLFPEHAGEAWPIVGPIGPLLERIAAEMERRRVVVLASGDPCFFGIGPLLAERLGRERVAIRPHPSAVALAFARLGLAWEDARVVSAHGRELGAAVRRARGASKLAVLTDEANTPGVVARALLDAGARDAEAWVFEHLDGPSERAVRSTLSALPELAFAALNVLVVPSLAWDGTDRAFGRPAADFAHAASLITKPEVRAVSLSKLRLAPEAVVWDVGAGSGSVAIEAAGLAPRGRVYAVERAEEQLGHLRRNVRAHARQAVVQVVAGAAPAILAGLPDPDAAFVGGGGADLIAILDACLGRLRPGGRLVANLATVERLAECLAWARGRSIAPEVVQVAVSRGRPIGGATRFEAENPVFVVTVEKGS